MEIDLLSAYLESSGSDFTYGVNFAVSGASTVNSGGSPFALSTQTGQFRHFQIRTRELREHGALLLSLVLLVLACAINAQFECYIYNEQLCLLVSSVRDISLNLHIS